MSQRVSLAGILTGSPQVLIAFRLDVMVGIIDDRRTGTLFAAENAEDLVAKVTRGWPQPENVGDQPVQVTNKPAVRRV